MKEKRGKRTGKGKGKRKGKGKGKGRKTDENITVRPKTDT